MFFQPNPAAGPIAGERITFHPTGWPGRISSDSCFTACSHLFRRQRTKDENRRQSRKQHVDESHFHVFAVNKSQNDFHAAEHKLGCLLRPMRTPRDSQIGRRE
jgi:hypothetical protein